jgi:HAD superfamily hydrolase (TIGR01509 family)
MGAPYRVLSLDLHDTLVWDTRAIVEAQYEVRWSVLAEGLRKSDGSRLTSADVGRAREIFTAEVKRGGHPIESIPVAAQVERIRQIVGAEYADAVEQVVRRYAEGGLQEHPPVLNPEAVALVRQLNGAGIPVVVVTDTSRTGSAWGSFLEAAAGLRIAHVIASTDVGACKPDPRIFAEAVRRTGVQPSEVLHVGDSWTWDVEGARASGMGAALYRGLWSRCWDPDHPHPNSPTSGPTVLVIDDLSEVRSLMGRP